MRAARLALITLMAWGSIACAQFWIGQVKGYNGPGDIIPGATAFWGLRCYTNAYTGNVADIWDAATGNTTETILKCSRGGAITATINPLATTCAGGCGIAKLYDQTGNGYDMADDGSRFTLMQSCLNTSLPCAHTSGTAR